MNNIPVFLSPNMSRYLTSAALAFLFLFSEIAQICMCSPNSSMSLPYCIPRERDALVKFKSTLHDPSNRLSSWKGNNCCQWEGIACDNVTSHVVKLDLSNPCLRLLEQSESTNDCDYEQYALAASNVDESLLELEYLSYLDLSWNDFQCSPIPAFIGSMRRLTHLSLSHAHVSGRIPSSLENLTNLRHLDLSWNYYFIDLAWKVYQCSNFSILNSSDINWISKLGSLEHLDLSHVDLGSIHNLFQVLNTLPSLLSLSLRACELANLTYPLVNVTNNNAPHQLLQLLDLSNNYLTSPVLDAVFQNMTTSQLVHLDLSGNWNLDSVPSWLSICEKLKYFDLSRNDLHGPIPDALRNLSTSIESLYLSENKFTTIPSWFSNFEKLVHLDISMNALSGPIPDIFPNMTTSIESLYLYKNHLTSVPCWFGKFKKLVHLDLSYNDLAHMECSVSSILTNLCHLRSLDFSSNKLQREHIGDSELSGCVTYDLEALDLSYNEFRGPLPTWLGQLENLKRLYLRSNYFYGPIPFSLGKLVKLRELDLGDNLFDGNLLNDIGQLVNLTHLHASSNKLSGFIPHSFGQLVSLQELDLSNNTLNGTIPQNIGKLVNLRWLSLSNNNLNGTIPQSLCHLNYLERLYLQRNKLHGNIPDDFDQLVNLVHIDLSSNELDGWISMGKEWSLIKPGLQTLNLSYNHINGSLPQNTGNIMPNLHSLFLANNLLNGSIPKSLCQNELKYLDLSKNKLSGEVPNCWRDTQSWQEINLSSNKLSGDFPSSFGNLSSLFWLHLNNNKLQGQLPVSMNGLTQLLIFDLGENQLSGTMPSWTADTFPSLQVLRLRQNKLSGFIPPQLCQLASLKILDLSLNSLEGSIPWCIGNLEGMTSLHKANATSVFIAAEAPIAYAPIAYAPIAYAYAYAPIASDDEWSKEDVKQVIKGREDDYIKILKYVVNVDLSKNKLVGSIPNGITRLTGLHGLNLSHNQLEGEIPKMIGNMRSLESFDVSHNHLSGKIPNSMPSLTSLSHLNLSHNNFSGPIPIGNQFSTYDSSIYIDNPYLCGHELPNKCPGDDSHEVPEGREYEEDDEDGKREKVEKMLFYFFIAVGFATGFWGVIGVLLLNKSWRHACFRWVEDKADNIYVAVVIKVAKLKKRMVRNNVDG
ncbi:hypothetical protein RIF29_23594 [Crotalaria pallida]|uniref:Leucine-rich repeat-containing N-terminal plant-type domain-containing protein n=1 Tax=Crotalaria pallida TaxID=3830 RepID=A0AAN9FAW9_CROPI